MMEETMLEETTTPTAPTKQHSTGRVIAAALVGVALGVGGVSLLWPASDDAMAVAPIPLDNDAPAAPADAAEGDAAEAGVADAEPAGTASPGTEPEAAGNSPTTTNDAPGDAGTVTPQNGVVDQATAEQAALAHLGEGRVTWVTREDDYGAAWEIEVTLPNGREVDVYVDANGQVVRTS
jgi:uncharacterized membrane protein YkoI